MLTWGRGNSGQLGLGDMVSSLEPKPVVGLEGCFITHVSAGWSHSGFVSGWLIVGSFLVKAWFTTCCFHFCGFLL